MTIYCFVKGSKFCQWGSSPIDKKCYCIRVLIYMNVSTSLFMIYYVKNLGLPSLIIIETNGAQAMMEGFTMACASSSCEGFMA